MATDIATFTVVDGQGKSSKTKVNTQVITAANFDATVAAVDAVNDAVADLIDGAIKQQGIEHIVANAWSSPSDHDIMRGRKWSVTMRDNTSNRLFVMQLPTALLNASGLVDPDSDASGNAILTSAHWSAFLTAMNSSAIKGPAGGTITVIKARLVTRRA